MLVIWFKKEEVTEISSKRLFNSKVDRSLNLGIENLLFEEKSTNKKFVTVKYSILVLLEI